MDILAAKVMKQLYQNANQALQTATVAEQIADYLQQTRLEARVAWMKGTAFSGLNLYEESIQCYQQAELYYDAIGDELRVAGSKINQINQLTHLGRYNEARKLLAEAEVLLLDKESQKAKLYLANLESHRANIAMRMGEDELALEVYERIKEIYLELSIDVNIALLDLSRSIALRNMQRFAEAEQALRQSYLRYKEGEYEQSVARVHLNFGVLSYMRGFYQVALDYFSQSYQGFAAIPEPVDMAVVTLYRSFVYRDLNLLPETVQMAASASQMMQKSKLPWQQALGMMNQGVAYERLGLYEKAKKWLTRSRRLLFRLGTTSTVWLIDADRAQLMRKQGRGKTAVRIARRVLKEINVSDSPALGATLHLLLAQCILDQQNSDLAAAQKHIEEGAVLAETFHLLKLRIEATYLRGVLSRRWGNLLAAKEQLQTAVSLILQWQQDLQWDEFRVGFMVDKVHIFAEAVSVVHALVERGETAVSELLYLLQLVEPPLGKNKTKLSHDKQAKIDQLRQSWHFLQSQLEGAGQLDSEKPVEKAVDAKAIYQQINDVERDLAEQLRQAQEANTGDMAADLAKVPADPEQFLAALQQCLKPDEQIWHYYMADKQVHALVVTADSLRPFPNLASLKTIQKIQKRWQFHIRYLATVLAPAGIATAKLLLQQLSSSLVQPLVDFGFDQPTIYLRLPPELADMPFAASYDGQRYLIEQFTLSYIQSPRQLLHRTERLDLSEAVVVGYSDGNRLPSATAEAGWVQNILTEQHTNSTTLIENEAQTERLLATMPAADLVHLSTHAVFRTDNPFFSWIRLANGRLTVNDLYQVQLEKRPFIFLSACETGKGQPRGGSSLGMARAFLAAGAEHLVVSRWPIVDTHAIQFVKDFYSSLVEKTAVGSALAHAQRQAIGRNEHPFFWTGYAHLQAKGSQP
ncbi:MAG: CHAT domain-containing tetratricopeptide repeat protein [Chloroflexota bacterium]